MEFLVDDVQAITGVVRNRLKEWLALGIIKPSIEEASGSGSRNIFDRKDLYLIQSCSYLRENLKMSREVILKYLKSIKEEDLQLLLAWETFHNWTPLREKFMRGDYLPNGLLKKGVEKDIYDDVLRIFDEVILSVHLKTGDMISYLVFFGVNFGEGLEVLCAPKIDTYSEREGFKTLLGHYDQTVMQKSDSMFTLNFSKIARSVDEKIWELYPEKIFSEDYVEEIRKAKGTIYKYTK